MWSRTTSDYNDQSPSDKQVKASGGIDETILQAYSHCLRPRHRVNLPKNVLNVELDRPLAYGEDLRYFPGGLSLLYPMQHLFFSHGKPWVGYSWAALDRCDEADDGLMEVRNGTFHEECQEPQVFFGFALEAAVDDFQKEIGFFASQQDRNLSWQEPADLRRDENREPMVLREELLKVSSYSPARSVFFSIQRNDPSQNASALCPYFRPNYD